MFEQRALPFTPRVADEAPYRPSRAQDETAEQLRRYAEQFARSPGGLTTVLLVGPEGSGKTRLLIEAVERQPGLQFEVLRAGATDPMDLFAEINRSTAAQQMLVIEACHPPERWYQGLASAPPPDLFSRLNAAPTISIDRPGPDALVPILLADLKLHGHKLSEGEVRYVAEALPRHFGAPRGFCLALDQVETIGSRRDVLKWAAERSLVRADA